MRRIKHFASVFALFAVLIGVGTTFTSGTAHAAQSPSTSSCSILQVRLNGQHAATTTCKSTVPLQKGLLHANISTSCDTSTRVQVYSETDTTGYLLCLDGTGTLNFADIWEPWPFWNWNDNIMSYESYSGRGTFYVDSYEHGRSFSFSPGSYSLNLGSWNNIISSIRM